MTDVMTDRGKSLVHETATQIGLNQKAVPEAVLTTLRTLNEAGYEAYIVGGGARDMLLGEKPADFDLVTNALPEQVRELFSRCRIIGRRFRLAHVFQGRHRIEVSTFRRAPEASGENRDSKSNNAYGTMQEDAYRRDFIANCIYYAPLTDEVHMHERSLDDIRARRLTVIGDPATRFGEDPVRMLRAVRLATRLNMEIENNARAIIPDCAEMLLGEPQARLLDEFAKLFHAGAAVRAFDMLRELKLFSVLFPLTDKYLSPADEADEQYEDLLYALLANTDERVKQDKPVVPAFILTGFLWGEIEARAAQLVTTSKPSYIAVKTACQKVTEEQGHIIAMPQRVKMMLHSICQSQWQFKAQKLKVLRGVAEQQKFRAAFDFLCLRSQVGLEAPDLCDWWERYQHVDRRGKEQMLAERARTSSSGQRRYA